MSDRRPPSPLATSIAQASARLHAAEQQFGADSLSVIPALERLVTLYDAQDAIAGVEAYDGDAPAIVLNARALSIKEKHLLNDLAALYTDQQRESSDIVPLYQRILAIDERLLGVDHPTIADDLLNLAAAAGQSDSIDRLALLQRALGIREAALGSDHPVVADCLHALGERLDHLGHADAADAAFQRAITILDAASGSHNDALVRVLTSLGLLFWGQGAFDRAAAPLKRVVEMEGRDLGANHPARRHGLELYADVLRKLGRQDEADTLQATADALRNGASNVA